MAKILIIAAATLALAYAVSAENEKIPFRKLFARRNPFSSKLESSPIPSNIELLTVTQRVDNYDPTNTNTWQQRYYVNNEFYRPGFPSFVLLSGEWEITPEPLTETHLHSIARSLYGNIFYLEHRYYGESRPTPNVTDENLRFLNSEQALGDIAHFINHIRATVEGASRSHFILVGDNYSASLAVWFRQRFPHLALGVWASSAPLPSVVDFDQFQVAVGRAFRNVGGDGCYNALEHGFTTMAELALAGEFAELNEAFRLCYDLDEEDIPFFFEIMAEIYSLLPTIATEASIRGTCFLLQGGGNELENVAAVLNIVLASGECIPIDREYIIEAERQTSWDAEAVSSGSRQYAYQLCSQIGWFHSSGSPDQPFGNLFPIEIFYQACQDVFGESFTSERLLRNSGRMNTAFGGLEPQVTNTVFVYGEHDPWSSIGRTTDLNDDATAIVIPGATMGNDLRPISPSDSEALLAAKLRISQLIHEWIYEADGIITIPL